MTDDKERKCSRCKVTKPLESFRKASSKLLGRTYACSECLNFQIREERRKNPEKFLLRDKKWRSNNKEKFKSYCRGWHREAKKKNPESYSLRTRNVYLKNKYGITLEEYNNLVEKQNNVCKICKSVDERQSKTNLPFLYIDHDHRTGTIRGLICQNCNTLLGFAKDNTDTLRFAFCYLTNYGNFNTTDFVGEVPTLKITKSREYTLKSAYGITKEQYILMWENQKGICNICREPIEEKDIRVDHCHKTGTIRGLLHNGCNLLLGHSKDSEQILSNALDYLESHRNFENRKTL